MLKQSWLKPHQKYVFIRYDGCLYPYRPLDIERFISKICFGTQDTCWVWMAGKDGDGYGQFYMPKIHNRRINMRAHRTSMELYTGQLIGHDLVVCHSCDNPSCVNPYHLFIGTNRENINDMINKGRSLTGVRNHASKLSFKQVKKIREKYNRGGYTLKYFADKYNMSLSNISDIVKNHIWKDVGYIQSRSGGVRKRVTDEERQLRAIEGERFRKRLELVRRRLNLTNKVFIKMIGYTNVNILSDFYNGRRLIKPHVWEVLKKLCQK